MLSSMSSRFVSEGRFASSFSWPRTIVVPTSTLDLLVARYGVPAFRKIDVAGFQTVVLEGLSRALRSSRSSSTASSWTTYVPARAIC
jgi:hypothetical protein